MTLGELIARFRSASNDKVEPYFWSDEEVTSYLNSAQLEAAIRGRLIFEVADPDVCSIDVLKGQPIYNLNPLLYEIAHASFKANSEQQGCRIAIKSPEDMDGLCGADWRERSGSPRFAVQADKWLRLVPTPDADGLLLIEGYRAPKPMLLIDADTVGPEISELHHEHLVNWALHKAFSIPDAESFDPQRSGQAERDFTEYFGIRPDSDLRRITREDVAHTVKPFFV